MRFARTTTDVPRQRADLPRTFVGVRRRVGRLTGNCLYLTQALVVAIVAGCSGGGGETTASTPPVQPGTLILGAPTPSVSINVAGTGTVTLTITRGGSFTGAVSLSLSGLPAGVTGSFAPASLDASSTSSVLTLNAGTTATAGTTAITIAASGAGVSTQSTMVQLTVVQPTISLALSAPTLSVTTGQTGTTTVSITRSVGFSGAVSFVLESVPTGVTGSFASSPTNGTTSVLTVTVGATAVAGTYNMTLRGSAAGVQDKTATVVLIVAASGPVGFTIAVDPVEFELPAGRGWSTNGFVTIARVNGFTGPVNVAVQGLSFPAVIGATPSTIASNAVSTNTLAFVIDGAAPGVYGGTVKVSAPGFADQTTPIRLRVSLPSSGGITWKFCRADRVPRYFAVRDGNGAWTHVVPSGPASPTDADPATFSFNLSQATASVAMINLGEHTSTSPLIEGFNWTVHYMTTQEIVALAAQECVSSPNVTTRTASGTVTGYQSFDAIVATAARLGQANVGSTGPLSTSLSMRNLPNGPFDLLVSRTAFTSISNPIVVRGIVLRRGLDPAPGGTVAGIDFASGEATPPATATLTFGNSKGENFFAAQTFLTTNGLIGLFSSTGSYASPARTWQGVPTAKLIAGDLHQVVATTANAAIRRQIITFSNEVTTKTLNFGPVLSVPVVTASTTTGGGFLRAVGSLAPDYVARVAMYYREAIPDPRTMTITASRGWLGGTSAYDVSIPDLSAAIGWMNAYNVRRSAAVAWTVTGGPGDPGGPFASFCLLSGICPVKPLDGTTYYSAQATGTVIVP